MPDPTPTPSSGIVNPFLAGQATPTKTPTATPMPYQGLSESELRIAWLSHEITDQEYIATRMAQSKSMTVQSAQAEMRDAQSDYDRSSANSAIRKEVDARRRMATAKATAT